MFDYPNSNVLCLKVWKCSQSSGLAQIHIISTGGISDLNFLCQYRIYRCLEYVVDSRMLHYCNIYSFHTINTIASFPNPQQRKSFSRYLFLENESSFIRFVRVYWSRNASPACPDCAGCTSGAQGNLGHERSKVKVRCSISRVILNRRWTVVLPLIYYQIFTKTGFSLYASKVVVYCVVYLLTVFL